MMFRKENVYLVDCGTQTFVGKFAGSNDSAMPLLQFESVMVLDRPLYNKFLQTGSLSAAETSGHYSFNAGFWVNTKHIISAIHCGVTFSEEKNNIVNFDKKMDIPGFDGQG